MILAFLVYLLVKPKRVEKSSTRTTHTRSTEASSSFVDQPSNNAPQGGKLPAERTVSIEPVSDITSVSNSRGDLLSLLSLFFLTSHTMAS